MPSYKGKYRVRNYKKYKGDPTGVVYRSLWERKFMDWCDKTPRVLQWWSEEIAIPYYDPVQKKWRRYFPDFWVRVREANGTIKSRSAAGGSNTATYQENSAWHSFSCNSSNGYDFKIVNQNSSPASSYSLELAAAADVNNTNYRHINCTRNSSSAGIFVVYGNGNVANANNSYGSTSDVKLKENIVDANSQWNDIKGLRVRNFNFIADSTNTKLLGLVAQEAETVCPSLVQEVKDVTEDENGVKSETGTVTKELKYSVLYMKAIKALQEAQTRIETLESKVSALEGS